MSNRIAELLNGRNINELSPEEQHLLVQEFQPKMILPEDDQSEDGEPFQINDVFYRLNESDSEVHVTLIYSSNFSDTNWFAEQLGYPDHDYDFEPVIVHIDKQSGDVSYTYDKGHYRSGTTESNSLEISEGAHYYTPQETGGSTLDASLFKPLSEEKLQAINSELHSLPPLWWGRGLSLDDAVNHPERVRDGGYFSGDDVEDGVIDEGIQAISDTVDKGIQAVSDTVDHVGEWFDWKDDEEKEQTPDEKESSTVQPDHPIEDGPESLLDLELQEQEQNAFDEIYNYINEIDRDSNSSLDSNSPPSEVNDSHDAVEGTDNPLHVNFWSHIDHDGRSLVTSLFGQEFVEEMDTVHGEPLAEDERLQFQEEQANQLLEEERAAEAYMADEAAQYSTFELDNDALPADTVNDFQDVAVDDSTAVSDLHEPLWENDSPSVQDTFSSIDDDIIHQ